MAGRRGRVRHNRRCRDSKAFRRNRRVAGVAVAAGGFLALGITPATAPSAHADLEDLIIQPIIDAIDHAVTAFDPGLDADSLLGTALSGHEGVANALAAVTPAAEPAAPETATIPLTMYKTVEPLVDLSVGGEGSAPVVVDTGSNGLTLPVSDVPLLSLFQSWDGSGIVNYGGTADGLDSFFVKLPETLDFTTTTGQVISDKTDVDVVLFSWPTSLSSSFWSFQSYWGSDGAAGVLGIAPDALGPDVGVLPPTAGLPGDLGQGC
ncbi:MAG: hypothetical protein ACRDTN_13645 [Mycobacterium sp.]